MISNLRDLGGIKTTDGKTIKKGCFIRSAKLSEAAEEDLKGISTVIDLRTKGERVEMPDMAWGREYLSLPVFEEITAGVSHEEEADEEAKEGKFPGMAFIYERMIIDHGMSFNKILNAIMDHDFDGGAILWHCSEGKDRCGLTSAMTLELLGVDRETIMKDYLKTNEVNYEKAVKAKEELAESKGEEFAEGIYQALIADESYLQAAWNVMGDDFYDRIGISKDKVEEFKRRVLE